MKKKLLYSLLYFTLTMVTANRALFAQAPPDTIKPAPAPLPAVSAKAEQHSVISMEYVKEKTTHSPDSTFFNILKITNTNANVVEGTVKVSVPEGWKIISQEETPVSIAPGTSTYLPIRVSLSRAAVGGVSYLVNATLVSSRALTSDKNQTSASKACYITIPKRSNWEIIAPERTVYFTRYSEYSPMKVRLVNKGNGNEVVKMDFDIGSSLSLHGSLGRKYFTSVELKPHSDTILLFPIKYIRPDESILWSRDFRSLSVKISAVSDSTVKGASVYFKYLESFHENVLAEKIAPLNLEVQLQNLLADSPPRLFVGVDGNVYFKNEHTLDYFARVSGIGFSGYDSWGEFGERALWMRSRMRFHYRADTWDAFAGDYGSSGISMMGIGGRGVGGSYRINKNHKISGILAAQITGYRYSGSVQHETVLPRRIMLTSALSFITDDYHKYNNFGASAKAVYPILPGHIVSLLVSGTYVQHLYDNRTFTDPFGNYITTTDPKATLYGMGAELNYNMNHRRIKASLSSRYASRHFSQYLNGQITVQGNGQYTFNKKYQAISTVNYTQHNPMIYHQGVLYPENKFTTGRYSMEIADRINSRLSLFAGPIFEHYDHRRLKILPSGDSVNTRFATASQKASLRLNYRSGIYTSVSPLLQMGYTYITHADDSTLGMRPADSKYIYYTANAGVNIRQKNWGVNVIYYTGPYSLATQSDYFYFGGYGKTIRVMPYFERYFFRKTLLVTSYNSYSFQSRGDAERITLNARLSFFLGRGWTFFVDNNMYMNSRITGEGTRVFRKEYALNLGFRKAFDIPQPGVKYYDLKAVCFKDINGNGKMDPNEQGLSDIVIMIDRVPLTDSVTKKSIAPRGQFSPAEMVTDNFGQVNYYHIPEGEFSVNLYPLANLKDLFNIKGQKQKVKVVSDTTYYIPFVQTFRVTGRVILKRDEYSSLGNVSTANIRITATDSSGNSFPALTSGDGSYTLYVPQAGEYKVTINNVFDNQFTLQSSEYVVSFDGAKEFQVDFIFNEKKRQINMSGPTGAAPANPPVPPGGAPKDTSSTVGSNTAPASEAGVTFRIQIGSSGKKIPKSQYATQFKGADKIQEYTQNGAFKYTAGEFSTWEFEKATAYKDELIAKGYKDAFIVFFKNGQRVK